MKNSLLIFIKALVSGVLLYLIILKIDWGQLIVSIKNGNLLYLSAGLGFGFVFNMIKFLKWRNLIRAGNNPHSYWDGAKSYMIGNSLGLVTPMRAGDLGRALYFPGEDRPRIIGLTIIDRIMDLIVVFILSIAGSFILINKGFGILVIILAFSGIFLLYTAGSLHGIFKRIIPGGRLGQKIDKLFDVLKTLDSCTISVALLLSFMAFLSTIFQFYYLVSAFEGISLISIGLVTPLITISAVLPVSLMGLGVRESVSMILLSKFGVSAAAAISAAFLLFVINNVSISMIGIFYLSRVKLAVEKVEACCSPSETTTEK